MSIRSKLSDFFKGTESKKEEKAEMKMSPKAYAKGEKTEKKSTSPAKKPVKTVQKATTRTKKAGK